MDQVQALDSDSENDDYALVDEEQLEVFPPTHGRAQTSE
jgi:hypothetical protein